MVNKVVTKPKSNKIERIKMYFHNPTLSRRQTYSIYILVLPMLTGLFIG